MYKIAEEQNAGNSLANLLAKEFAVMCHSKNHTMVYEMTPETTSQAIEMVFWNRIEDFKEDPAVFLKTIPEEFEFAVEFKGVVYHGFSYRGNQLIVLDDFLVVSTTWGFQNDEYIIPFIGDWSCYSAADAAEMQELKSEYFGIKDPKYPCIKFENNLFWKGDAQISAMKEAGWRLSDYRKMVHGIL